jgi:hypothetical protein
VADVFAELKAAYEQELANHNPPRTAGDLPITYEEITDEWLTSVICQRDASANVTSHRLDAADDGNTSRRRIFLEYNAAGRAAGLPTSVFCKASFRLATRISVGICGGLESEVAFFNQIRPLLDIEAPVGVWANFNPKTLNSIIMLRDLAGGTEFCTLGTDMTEARVRSQLALLAKFHGQFFQIADAHPALSGIQTWPQFFFRALQIGMPQLCANGFKAGKGVMPARLYARESEIWPATLASVERHNHLPHTLIHADVHLRNWYVAASGEMGLSDWQNACKGHWGRDVAYTMCTALDVDRRRKLDRSLLKYYLEQLHEAGGPRVPFDEAWTCFKQELLPALAWWTVTLMPSADMPDMQPKDASLEMIRRLTHAIDDLDALDTLV